MLAAAPLAIATGADSTTDYDRNAENRGQLWDNVDLGREAASVGNLGAEMGTPARSVDSTDVADLSTMHERLVAEKDDTEFGAFLDSLDDYDDSIANLGPRIDTLENMEYNWVEDPSLAQASGGYVTGTSPITGWTPSINRQTSDFTQYRDLKIFVSEDTTHYERNIATKETRIKEVSKDSWEVTKTEGRAIAVNTTPWTNNGGKYECLWSPSPSTVQEGESFTQDGTKCKQDQTRTVSYTLASTGQSVGSAWTDNQTVTGLTDQRIATGTKRVKKIVPPQ
ncbi:MAG: hypothetical protein SWN10_23615 [Pseudomonadota bacterium]|nr:hypothetical protein [Pseudomonadota bacterium]